VKRRIVASIVAAVTITLAACGSESREMAGAPLEPVPQVGAISLPDLTNGGSEFALRAAPEGLLLVYFGYTNCPDFCPTTLSNVKLARQQLDDPERIDLAMVTVDPGRDLPVLAAYVTGFLPEAHALGTDDPEALAAAAAPFQVAYDVREVDGEIQVGHTTALYAVDDGGRMVLRWRPDVTIDALAADFEQLLDE
jgi:protein SCO1/2